MHMNRFYRILITGCNGYLGRYLSFHLSKIYYIIGLDCSNTHIDIYLQNKMIIKKARGIKWQG